MNINLVLRIILAVVFALVAFIFSEVIPDIPPFNHILLRVAVTVWTGLVGFGLFPDLAKKVKLYFISMINFFTVRLTTEIVNQLSRLPRHGGMNMAAVEHNVIGGVSLNQPLIADTSALIDGRLLDIAKIGFLYGTMLIPNFILTELQQVADSADYIKRTRGRRGFEVVEGLKKIKKLRVEVWDREVSGKTADDKLLRLAKSLNGKIITTDFNLNKVATISGVMVLNINDLANAIKTNVIPGEIMSVKIVHLGKDTDQGVGYLADGTMIVVENGAKLAGKEIKVEVSRVLQGSAGKMIFTKKV